MVNGLNYLGLRSRKKSSTQYRQHGLIFPVSSILFFWLRLMGVRPSTKTTRCLIDVSNSLSLNDRRDRAIDDGSLDVNVRSCDFFLDLYLDDILKDAIESDVIVLFLFGVIKSRRLTLF